MKGNSMIFLSTSNQGDCQDIINYISSNPNVQLVTSSGKAFVWEISKSDYEKDANSVTRVNGTAVSAEETVDLSEFYSKKLDDLGMKLSLTGRRYLLDALVLLKEGTDKNLICDMLATRYGKKESSIRAAMSRAIKGTWETMDSELMQQQNIMNRRPHYQAPTVMEFLHYYI
ncbi:MAG: sporulation initiation factor Spo0A C-terminal domain-containing protein [Turicibacter sp.]|nr:sporulation initiation factor Spo0A C-terminal domain-containing protein [Turicibacter sp.]